MHRFRRVRVPERSVGRVVYHAGTFLDQGT